MLELLRSLAPRGIEIHVIDPEDEYTRLAATVACTYVHLAAEQVPHDPMDLPIHTRPDGRRTEPHNALIRRSLFLHTVISMLLGSELEATERAAQDPGITVTYRHVGITSDLRTWTRPAPLLTDLAKVLADAGDPAGVGARRGAWIRLHDFGGFFSAPYLQAWLKICRARPDTNS
jgi:hypothetical protein